MSQKVKLVNKIIRLSKWEIVRYQINHYCYMNNIIITNRELDCLTLLALRGEVEIQYFCNLACMKKYRNIEIKEELQKEIFGSVQTVRNTVKKLEKMNLINTINNYRKRNQSIVINEKLNIFLDNNLFINLKLISLDTNNV